MSISLRSAIDAMCKHCIYDPLSGLGTWRQQVEACTAPKCPLYEVRPRSKPSKGPTGNPVPAGLARWKKTQS